ncbi:protein NETWORKED 3A-like isoform X2 [Salvia hispanica]|uniref:protein NETWORKED 3A-like isoform X2 n=1 Tax=Salvia hispanica TaxID=49212 RepID=UPI0020093B90|nr:protein NETWORKED 3A-like isoform X2 [Salvia hispanica]
MLEGEDKWRSSQWWWLHINNKARSNRSLSLNSILADEKTSSTRKLIEQDVESFSKRAEAYYNMRPKLISMVHDFHRMHTSLAESYDQLIKFEIGKHLLTSSFGPLYVAKNRLRKSVSLQENVLHSYSNGCKLVEFDEPEVDDPEEKGGGELEKESSDCEWKRLKEELERLRKENKVQREELMQKDEDKRDVIRQLSLAMDLLMEENLILEKSL